MAERSDRPIASLLALAAGILCAARAIAGPDTAAPPAARDAAATRRFPIAGHGLLVLDVPVAWSAQVVPAPSSLTITFDTGNGRGSAIALNVMQNPTLPKGFNSSENIRLALSGVADRMALASGGARPALQELRGTSGGGYYFSSLLKPDSSGRLMNLTQGQIGLGDLLLTFNVFSQDPDVVRAAVAMVRQARWAER